jgi:hypothetical protein
MAISPSQAPMSDAVQAARLQNVKKIIADARDLAISVKTELAMATRSAQEDAERVSKDYKVDSIQDLHALFRKTYDANDAMIAETEASAAIYANAVAAAQKIILDAKAS